MHSVQERKELLRKQFRRVREQLDPAVREKQSLAACETIYDILELHEVRTIHLYWPLLDRGELDTRPLIRTLQEERYQIVLPRIVQPGDGEPRMTHHAFKGADDLVHNEWGVAEPSNDDVVPASEIDAVIVPAFGAGRNGHRIGHGSGYYDAFLADISPLTLCAVFDECLIEKVPSEPHDVPLQYLVTASEKIRVLT